MPRSRRRWHIAHPAGPVGGAIRQTGCRPRTRRLTGHAVGASITGQPLQGRGINILKARSTLYVRVTSKPENNETVEGLKTQLEVEVPRSSGRPMRAVQARRRRAACEAVRCLVELGDELTRRLSGSASLSRLCPKGRWLQPEAAGVCLAFMGFSFPMSF